MIYWIAKQFTAQLSFLNLFSYLTLRAIFAAISALAISLIIGPWMIDKLSRYQIGQVVRDDGPQTHLKKAGTPTMGGLLILVAIIVSTLLSPAGNISGSRWRDSARRWRCGSRQLRRRTPRCTCRC